MELGHLLTRSGLTYPEVSSKVCHDSFCQLGNSGIVMRNTIAYPTQQSSSPSRGIPCSYKRGNDDRVTTVMPSLNMPVHRLKVAILPLDLPCSGPVTHSGETLTTGKSLSYFFWFICGRAKCLSREQCVTALCSSCSLPKYLQR
jgi:hypothetical protein